MKEFNWSEFKDKNNIIAVHCKTEEEAKDFCKQMHEHGMRWMDRDSYLDCIAFSKYKDMTCYSNAGGYSAYRFYNENGFTILEWSDYMQKEFTKADLKDGMIAEERAGERYAVYGDKMLTNFDWNSLDDYSDDLREIKYKKTEYDIVKVFTVKCEKLACIGDIFKDENLELIWQRTETKRMTAEEMRQKLEEMTGDKIEIEPTREEMIGKLELYCAEKSCSKCVLSGMSPDCNYWKCDSEKLKQCYEKVMEDGRN